MEAHTHSSARGAARLAVLPALVMIGMLASLTNAFAWDRQATDDAMSYAISLRAAHAGNSSSAYAHSVHEGVIGAPRHRRHR